MPILRDAGILDQRFGDFVVGAGAAGEFGPVVVVSVILAFDADEPLRALLLFAFAAIVVAGAIVALRARPLSRTTLRALLRQAVISHAPGRSGTP